MSRAAVTRWQIAVPTSQVYGSAEKQNQIFVHCFQENECHNYMTTIITLYVGGPIINSCPGRYPLMTVISYGVYQSLQANTGTVS
jgi:hypothetical protein